MSTSSSSHRLAIGALDLFGGIPTLQKNMKVSWDDYSQYMESHKIHVPNHQPVMASICFNSIFVASTTMSQWLNRFPPSQCRPRINNPPQKGTM